MKNGEAVGLLNESKRFDADFDGPNSRRAPRQHGQADCRQDVLKRSLRPPRLATGLAIGRRQNRRGGRATGVNGGARVFGGADVAGRAIGVNPRQSGSVSPARERQNQGQHPREVVADTLANLRHHFNFSVASERQQRQIARRSNRLSSSGNARCCADISLNLSASPKTSQFAESRAIIGRHYAR